MINEIEERKLTCYNQNEIKEKKRQQEDQEKKIYQKNITQDEYEKKLIMEKKRLNQLNIDL